MSHKAGLNTTHKQSQSLNVLTNKKKNGIIVTTPNETQNTQRPCRNLGNKESGKVKNPNTDVDCPNTLRRPMMPDNSLDHPKLHNKRRRGYSQKGKGEAEE